MATIKPIPEAAVKLIDYTSNARELLIFSKRTRHMTAESEFADVLDMPEEQKAQEMDYVFSTIGSSWEFITYTFYITNVTRAFTHQLVRHRVGVAFAQQAQRVGTQENFGYMIPPSIAANEELFDRYVVCMIDIQRHYSHLIKMGARPQDARGVLPTNIHTNILMKVNLRALSDMLTVRLCLRAQGEFQNVARMMQKLVLGVHPWAAPVLAPNCLRYGVCKFPRYADCPISQRYTELTGLSAHRERTIRELWEEVAGYDPQPTGTYKDYDMDKAEEHCDPDIAQDLMLLVMDEEDVPSISTIVTWTQEERDEVAQWAGARHLNASDNPDVEVPPEPEVIKRYKKFKEIGG